MNWKIHIHFRVRNESICYIVFIDRTKPDNSVRINPATRHSETKYGFVILTGDMIFKDFFVGMKLLLRHERLSYAAANSHQNQLTCHALTCSPCADGGCHLSKSFPEHTAKGPHRQCGDGCQSPRGAYARKISSAQLVQASSIECRLPVMNKSKRMVGVISLGDVSHSASGDLLSECVKSVSAHH